MAFPIVPAAIPNIIVSGLSIVAETLPLFIQAVNTVQAAYARFQNKDITKEELIKQWQSVGVKVALSDAKLNAAMDKVLEDQRGHK